MSRDAKDKLWRQIFESRKQSIENSIKGEDVYRDVYIDSDKEHVHSLIEKYEKKRDDEG